MQIERDEFLDRLVGMLYERNDIAFERGKFRVRGDVVEVYPAYLEDEAIRVEFFGDEIERISSFDPLTGTATTTVPTTRSIPPNSSSLPRTRCARRSSRSARNSRSGSRSSRRRASSSRPSGSRCAPNTTSR